MANDIKCKDCMFYIDNPKKAVTNQLCNYTDNLPWSALIIFLTVNPNLTHNCQTYRKKGRMRKEKETS